MKIWNTSRELIEWISHHHSPMHGVNGVDPALLYSTQVEVAELSTATYDDVQDYINMAGDRTLISGGAISDSGSGQIDIASCTAWCKETDSDTAVGKFFNYAGKADQALTDITTNFVYLDYNAGTPQIVVATSIQTYGHKQDHIFIGAVFRNGNALHWHQSENLGIGGVNRQHMHHSEEAAVHRASGMVTSSTGTRNLSLTVGVLYAGLNRHPTLAFDTSRSGTADEDEANKLHDADGDFTAGDVGKSPHNITDDTYGKITAYVNSGELTLAADTFPDGNEAFAIDWWSYWYYNFDGSAWVEVPGSLQINNTQYNLTGSGTGLATLSAAAKYGVHWVYMENDGQHFHIVYGQGDYFANQAEEAGVPALLPNIVVNYCTLIAKIIVQKSTDTLVISYPWTAAFASTLATDHGSLGGSSDDDHTQYIKDSEFTKDSSILVGTGSGTFAEEDGATLRTSIDTYSTAEVDAIEAALDYGLSFEGIVTTITDSTHFKVATLAGKGTGFFKPTAGMPYEIYVVEADGAAPEGQQTPVVAYTTADGTFQHAAFSTNDLEVGDIVLIIHPLLATLGTKATTAAAGAVTTTDYLMAYIKQLVTLLIAQDVVVDNIHDTDLPAVKSDTAAIIADTEDLQGNVDAMHDTDLPAVKTVVDALDTLTKAAGNGDLAAMKTAVDAIVAAGPTKAEMDTAHALLATPANVASELATYDPPTRAEATSDKDAVIAAIPAMVGTNSAALASVLGALNDVAAEGAVTDADTAMQYIKQLVTALILVLADTGELQTDWVNGGRLDNLLDTAAAGYTHADWKGNFTWDTSVFTTDATDISNLFSTDLAIATRRKYSVKLDLTTVEADGSFVSCYIIINEKIDGTNYRCIDRKLVEKADIASSAEPGIIIEIPATSENIQITMQMTTATAGDCTIYYSVVKEVME